ncbi:hypothetical protein D3C76_797180 [compost metagenome]
MDAEQAVVLELTQVVTTTAQLQQAEIAEQTQRPGILGDGELDFPFEQAHQTLLGIEAHIGGAAGVQVQLAAIVQLLAPPFAHRAAVVGKQAGQRVVRLQGQAGSAADTENQQGLQCPPAAGRTRCLQRRMGQWRRQPAQTLVDPLDMLPGPAMFFMGLQPLLHGLLLARIECAALQFDQPVHGLFGHLRREFLMGAVHRAK